MVEALPLSGRVAVVTGASRGIGRGVALALAEQGADVVLADLQDDDDDARATAADVAATGRAVEVVRADVADEGDVARLFARGAERFGRLDILVNNAGISQAVDVFSTTLTDWHRVLDVNLTGAFLCAREAMRLMAPQRAGRIVNVSSVVAHQGALLGHAHYAASKAGLLGLTRTLARTGAPLGITVNAVAPGIIETDLLHRTHGSDGIARLAAQVPLGLGRPRDVGLAVAFLCGPGARYITGATLDVNGGQYMR
jgi:NAD(P)-dependent dehydrogenase (short-subunit alcohol dehydrogenase family)